ncbi:hypothetical protein PtrV1_12474 [Pyrenophora tritici-repentis]|nr:hypothetical protein PtrV1_12474 [Pyrenophora tritici-repentis]KAI0580722.1 hypothetical protein Alg215_05058 [Pyrenophora tritici-repentis]KAI1573579.1 hypothetical protein PtrEW4_003651 [Pyrenophora tritici-repentis]PZC95933.1 hypothetical protein A1F95_05681 [Pyrenophora tritici-repentis]
MRFESSILIASLAASVLAAPAPYPQLTLNKRWVDTSGNPLPEHFVNTVRKLSSEKLKAKRQLDQLLGGLTGAAGGAGAASGSGASSGSSGASSSN